MLSSLILELKTVLQLREKCQLNFLAPFIVWYPNVQNLATRINTAEGSAPNFASDINRIH